MYSGCLFFFFFFCLLVFEMDGSQFTERPNGTNFPLPFSPFFTPPQNSEWLSHKTSVALYNLACYIHLVYIFTPMKSNTHSMWESFIILESKYPLKYLHFTVKRIAKHKVMYKLRYSSFWSMENGGRNESTTTNHIFKNLG